MDGSDFIEFASSLAARNSGPAANRSAASRAYYGAYHVAVDFLSQLGYKARSEKTHPWVQRQFKNCQSEDFVELGDLLETLHHARNVADYELHRAHADGQTHAMSCVEWAVQIRDELRRIAQSDRLETIRKEMELYRNRLGPS